MTDDAMKQFAELLGRNDSKVNVLNGHHTTRMSRNVKRKRDEELQDIFTDWWNLELHQLQRRIALEKLISIFEKIDDCKPLAFNLKNCSAVQEN